MKPHKAGSLGPFGPLKVQIYHLYPKGPHMLHNLTQNCAKETLDSRNLSNTRNGKELVPQNVNLSVNNTDPSSTIDLAWIFPLLLARSHQRMKN